MKISILNHCYLTPSHIDQLKKLGEVTEYSNTTTEADALERSKGSEVIIADGFEFSMNKSFFESAKDLKYVCLNSTGFDIVDIQAAKEKGIHISNLPGFSTEAVAEHAIALMFAVSRKIVTGNRAMHEKPFQLNPANRAHDMYIGKNLKEKTLGVIGLGQIGTRITELGKGLGMKVVGYNRTPKEIAGVTMVDLDTLFKQSDMIILAAAYGENLKYLINEKSISQMQSEAIIINIGRGEFVDETAMSKALSEHRIAGFGADVITNWSLDNPLLKFENVVLTPHMAFLADESLKNMADMIVRNVESFVRGKAENVVNL